MILKRMSFAIALAVVTLGMAAGLEYARNIDLIGPDAARRIMQVTIGLILAAYSNLMPKDVGPWRASAAAVARTQAALRVGGWSLTLAGLAYAGLWAFAPLAFADVASTRHRRLGDVDHDGISRVDAACLPLEQTTAS